MCVSWPRLYEVCCIVGNFKAEEESEPYLLIKFSFPSPPGPLSSTTACVLCLGLPIKYHKLRGFEQRTICYFTVLRCQEARHRFTGSSARSLPGWNQGVSGGSVWSEALGPSPGSSVIGRNHHCSWRTETSSFLLAVSWGLLSTPKSLPPFSVTWPPHRPSLQHGCRSFRTWRRISFLGFKYLTPERAQSILRAHLIIRSDRPG